MDNYIKKSIEERRRVKNTLHGRELVVVAHPLPEDISLDNVLRRVETSIPHVLLQDLDAIYIGDFDILKDRNLKGLYLQGTVYLTNEQASEHDMYEALIHEIAHNVEEVFKDEIYLDGTLKREFLGKRRKLLDILNTHGYNNIELLDMMDHKFNQKLDNFFYWELGYDRLAYFINGIFVKPYSVTSLREYWGKGFEEYVSGKKQEVAKICPVLYGKIEDVFNYAY